MTVHHLPAPWVDRIAEVTRESYPTDLKPKPRVVRKTDWVSITIAVIIGYVLGSMNNQLFLDLIHWWRTNP